MPSRRKFLASLAFVNLYPASLWADLDQPRFLSAGLKDNRNFIFGIGNVGNISFSVELPDRGHAAAIHPWAPLAVAFARRPGDFGFIINCLQGKIINKLVLPKGRHFYGHGVFSPDGRFLLTTENFFEKSIGLIGVWDSEKNYTRVAEYYSGGIGPHDIIYDQISRCFVVANGGIETHPETGRVKLNIPFMEPNLTYLKLTGKIIKSISLGRDIFQNSIRHLSANKIGDLAFAMQWQGEKKNAPALLGLKRKDGQILLLKAPEIEHALMQGYAGSVTFSTDGSKIAISSPKSGIVQFFISSKGIYDSNFYATDVCGLSSNEDWFVMTTGNGDIILHKKNHTKKIATNIAWDNHLIKI